MNDQPARTQALDVSQSFLMQAPAGSGKTEVLTQRFLALLAVVEHPEQILALTFTKKAAAEMRFRLLQALHLGRAPAPPNEPALGRWRLAQQVLAVDSERQWHLLSSPHRLRLYTIDSLCATLVKQSPLQVSYSGFRICADPSRFYEQAVTQTLYARNQPWLAALQRLLVYFNTDYGYFQGLLEVLLSQRQNWVGEAQTITAGLAAARFTEATVLTLFEQQLTSLKTVLGHQLASAFAEFEWHELWPLVCFAQSQFGVDWDECLQPEELSTQHWQGLAEIILKKDGEIRQRFDKNAGFPASAKVEKQGIKQAVQLLVASAWADAYWSDVQTALQLIQLAPHAYTDDPQHSLALDVFQLGLAAVQQLEALFQQERQVDYTGLAQSALESLGDDTNPSDVLLRFDYQVQHLLMDEFQDTSSTQMQLFERMTLGWQANDGRSLFFVGDPMQSIYGFRNADVNLFLQVKHQGLGDIHLQFLQLQRNFRSEPALVRAVQTLLAPVFPRQDNGLLQQVTFAKATPAQKNDTLVDPIKACIFEQREHEINWLVQQIQLDLTITQGRIAVLARKKNHVPAITQALRTTGIGYTAIDLDPLWAFTAVKDLYHLAAVLFETPQSYHFFAVCRGPFIGLSLPALELLASIWPQNPGLSRVRQGEALGLSNQEHLRLQGFLNAVHRFQSASALTPVERLRGLWFCLLGPETTPLDEQQAVQDFWGVLEELQGSLSLPELHQRLLKANTSVIDSAARVEIMTIHRSKGLEFDIVFIPCLDSFDGAGHSPFVDVFSFQLEQAQTLFAVAASTDKLTSQESSKGVKSTAGFVRALQKCRDRHELARLLYVAVTRAERGLRLCATLKPNAKGEQKPKAKSVLAYLQHHFDYCQCEEQEAADVNFSDYQVIAPNSIKTIMARCDYYAPLALPKSRHPSQYGLYWPAQLRVTLEQTLPQQFGQLAHLWFACIQIDQLDAQRSWRAWFRNAIASFGWRVEAEPVLLDACESLVAKVHNETHLHWLLQSRTYRWREHAWEIQAANGQITTYRPDLIFIDEEAHSTCWIVDFKISADFLERKKKSELSADLADIQTLYGDQLGKYGQLVAAGALNMQLQTINLAIYKATPSGAHFWSWSA